MSVGEPVLSGSLWETLAGFAETGPERVAFRFLVDGEGEGTSLTYAELAHRARVVARALLDRGEPGSRALVMCPPGLDYVVSLFGCLCAGVVPVPVYPPSALVPGRALGRLRAVIADVGATLGLTVNQHEALVRSEGLVELGMEWVMVDRCEGDEAAGVAAGEDEVMLVQYTSGSTGDPKGVVLSNGSMMANLKMIQATYGIEPGDIGVSWLPPYHDMGLVGCIFFPAFVGGTGVLMSPNAFLRRPLRWLEAISRYRGVFSPAPNFAYADCLRRTAGREMPQLDLSSWRVAINGAEPVRTATLEDFASTFAPHGLRRDFLWPSYGMAETVLLVSAAPLGVARALWLDRDALGTGHAELRAEGDPGTVPVVTCGPPCAGSSVVAVDQSTLLPCGEGEVGELWVSGPHLAEGYWQRPHESAERFQAKMADGSEGKWLRTGDLGIVHEGQVVVTGRAKDVVIIRGVNYYPQDFEQSAQDAHPGLRPDYSVAFSVPGPSTEQLVIVQGTDIARDDQLALSIGANAIVKRVTEDQGLRPDEVVLVLPKHVPRTTSGKVRRSATRAAYLADELPALYRWKALS